MADGRVLLRFLHLAFQYKPFVKHLNYAVKIVLAFALYVKHTLNVKQGGFTKSYLLPKTASTTCLTCGTSQEGSVEADEDGAYVHIETDPCPICKAELCGSCESFVCDCCGLRFCNQPDHIGEAIEPDCTCEMHGDQQDTRGCELHSTHFPKTYFICVRCNETDSDEIICRKPAMAAGSLQSLEVA